MKDALFFVLFVVLVYVVLNFEDVVREAARIWSEESHRVESAR